MVMNLLGHTSTGFLVSFVERGPGWRKNILNPDGPQAGA